MPNTDNPNSRSPTTAKSWLTDTWALEAAAAGLAATCLIAIVILLNVYDGHPEFSFGGITLNAVVAILAAGVRIGFMVPIAESLAQWKWIWFAKKSRPLGDFDSLDDASRGSRGSALLLWETKSMTLTSIAAWITLLSIATEPFIQQIVSFDDVIQYHDSDAVQIPYAGSWSGGTEIGDSGDSSSSSSNGTIVVQVDSYGTVSRINLDTSGQAAVLFGLASSRNDVSQQLTTACPSGNCTWPSYVSLGVCSKCTDLSKQLTTSEKVDYPQGWYFPASSTYWSSSEDAALQNLTSYALPNGLSIDNRETNFLTYNSADSVGATELANLKPSTTLTLSDMTTLLFSASVLRTKGSSYPQNGFWPSNPTIEATECGLYLCAKEHASSVVSGRLTEDFSIVSSTRDPTSFQPNIPDAHQIQGVNEPLTYSSDISPAVDALFSNATYLPRFPLTILIPNTTQDSSSNHISSVNITQPAIDALSSYLYNLFDEGSFTNIHLEEAITTGCSTDGRNNTCGILRNLTGMAVSDGNATYPTSFSPAIMQRIYNAYSIPEMFENVALSLSNEFRRNADGSPFITGRLGTVRTVLKVRWEWITLPVFCVLVSMGFFAYTIFENRRGRLPVWKGSALAGLFHGLEDKVRRGVEEVEGAHAMNVMAEEVKVRLGKEDGIWGLRVGDAGDGGYSNAKHNSDVEMAQRRSDEEAAVASIQQNKAEHSAGGNDAGALLLQAQDIEERRSRSRSRRPTKTW